MVNAIACIRLIYFFPQSEPFEILKGVFTVGYLRLPLLLSDMTSMENYWHLNDIQKAKRATLQTFIVISWHNLHPRALCVCGHHCAS